MPQPTKPQLAVYAALAIAVLLIGARFLRTGEGGDAGGAGAAAAAPLAEGGGLGAPDGASGGAGAEADAGGSDLEGAGGSAGGGAAGGGAAAGGAAAGGDLGSATAGGVAGAACDPAAGACDGVVVDVKGAVRRPGVYRLTGDARALDAVRLAGGLSARADRRGVNLAARVVDGGEVIVPRRGERRAAGGSVASSGVTSGAAAPSAGATDDAAAPGAPLEIDLNTATAEELEQLDGVGPATAAKIVAFRDQNGGIESVDELDEVSGIGEAKLAAIHAQLGR